MDEQKIREAIEYFSKHISAHDSLPKPFMWKGKEECETAIEALEKQLPIKVEFLYMVDNKRARFKCKCGNTFVHECPTFPYKDMDFCDNCGQRLDWSEQS